MIIVKPQVTIKQMPSTKQALLLCEYGARLCYKSENKGGTKESAETILRDLLSRKPFPHESVIEHVVASVHFVVDRGVTHEIVRHRLCSFSQECVAGDTEVRKGYTIRELYSRSKTQYGKTHNKTLRLKSIDKYGKIIDNTILTVFSKGIAPVFEVRTKLGYSIKTTENHEFMIKDGYFSLLRDLSIGDQVMVNGRPCLLQIDDMVLREEYLQKGLEPLVIAEDHGVPYRTVLRRLHDLGIFEKHKNNKNLEKYQNGHNAESVQKMKESVLKGYENGRRVWNKDLTETENASVALQAESLRLHHHNNGSEENNSNWKGGISRPIAYKRGRQDSCEVCNAQSELFVHHIDINPENNDPTNLLCVCGDCHNKLHHGWYVGKIGHLDEIVSIQSAGITDVYDLEMAGSMHNYVANGFIVHNSTRYCNYSKDKFGNQVSFIEPHFIGERNAQISAKQVWKDACEYAEVSYGRQIAFGQSPQIARALLPTCTKSEILWTANFRQWRHIFSLRTAKVAHPQMREVMIPLLRQFQQLHPVFFENIPGIEELMAVYDEPELEVAYEPIAA